ncbi:uncharacterized protein [Sylvia atricapilla]|uniref:uncharacterized protein n=1 Tax=Sylvia atricapilla TaxID=48155 RepID=UPI00339243C5
MESFNSPQPCPLSWLVSDTALSTPCHLPIAGYVTCRSQLAFRCRRTHAAASSESEAAEPRSLPSAAGTGGHERGPAVRAGRDGQQGSSVRPGAAVRAVSASALPLLSRLDPDQVSASARVAADLGMFPARRGRVLPGAEEGPGTASGRGRSVPRFPPWLCPGRSPASWPCLRSLGSRGAGAGSWPTGGAPAPGGRWRLVRPALLARCYRGGSPSRARGRPWPRVTGAVPRVVFTERHPSVGGGRAGGICAALRCFVPSHFPTLTSISKLTQSSFHVSH